jgi:8-amino-7-oxononanoate synthase
VNSARSFVYTTGLPPAVVGGVSAAIELVMAADYERKRITELSERFRAGLRRIGLDSGSSKSQIQPVVLRGAAEVVEAGRRLEALGVLAVPIRPPTVPQGGARLRFSICAAHTGEDIDLALGALTRVAGEAVHAG